MKATKALAITLVAVSLSVAVSGQAADRVISPKHASLINDFRKVPHASESPGIAITTTFKSPRALQAERDLAKVARACEDDPNLIQRPLYTGKNPFGTTQPSVQIAPVK